MRNVGGKYLFMFLVSRLTRPNYILESARSSHFARYEGGLKRNQAFPSSAPGRAVFRLGVFPYASDP